MSATLPRSGPHPTWSARRRTPVAPAPRSTGRRSSPSTSGSSASRPTAASAELEVTRRDAEIESRRQALAAAQQRREVLERLKQRHRAEHQAADAHRAAATLDEMALADPPPPGARCERRRRLRPDRADPGHDGLAGARRGAGDAASSSTSPTAFASSLQAATSAAAPTATTGTTATTGAATPFAAEIDAAAARNGVDPALLRGLIRQESNFNADARSPAGAMGLTQLMPATAAGLGVTNPSDPAQSIEGGAKYLKQQLDRFGGDVSKALAAYNAGPGAVQKYNGVPPYAETQNYVKNVTAYANEYRQQAGTAATTATATTATSAGLSASPLVTAALGVQTPTVPAATASTGMNYSTT